LAGGRKIFDPTLEQKVDKTEHPNDKQVKMVVADFLCIHKDYRDKRLAPEIVKELIRRTNLKGINQAVATCGTRHIAAEIAKCKFFHRPIQVKRLIDANYWFLDDEVGY